MPAELPVEPAAVWPSVHAALIASYQRDADAGDPRVLFMTDDPAERARLNERSPLVRQARHTAERLCAGELVAIDTRRVARLPGAEWSPWLANHPYDAGVIVAPDDTVRPAPKRR